MCAFGFRVICLSSLSACAIEFRFCINSLCIVCTGAINIYLCIETECFIVLRNGYLIVLANFPSGIIFSAGEKLT